MTHPDDLRPAGVADVPLIQDDLLDYARTLAEIGEHDAAQRMVDTADELVAEAL